MTKLKINQLAVISLLALGVTACGGGGGGSKVKVYSGVFKDSNVQGLSYESGGQKGITNENAEFKYEEGGKVSFSIGGVRIGSAKGKNVLTPMDLVTGGKEDSPEVINRVRFLMMLDEDDKASNGILISKEVRESFAKLSDKEKNLKFTDDKFEGDILDDLRLEAALADKKGGKAPRHRLPSITKAQEHFDETLRDIRATSRCRDTGAFVGEFTGSEKGNIGMILDPASGGLKGSIYSTGTPLSIIEKDKISYIKDARNFASQTKSGSKLFTGKLASNKLTGNWKSDDGKKSGAFTASRLSGSSGADQRFTATYKDASEESLGLVAFDIDSKKRLTGKIYDIRTGVSLDIEGKVKAEVGFLKFENVKFEGGEITGKAGKGRTLTITHDKASIPDFTFESGSGCTLNK